MSSLARDRLDRVLLEVDPKFRAEELEVQVRALRRQRDRGVACVAFRELQARIRRIRGTR